MSRPKDDLSGNVSDDPSSSSFSSGASSDDSSDNELDPMTGTALPDPPAYQDINPREYHAQGPEFDSLAQVNDDGGVDLWLDLTKPLPELPVIPPPKRETSDFAPQLDCPPLNIVIFVVGSRGDVQPYMALALRLIERNGHRVRIATHTTFRDLVLGGNDLLKDKSDARGPLAGRLEFFDVGGDPKELMAYMVKNPGLMPGFESLVNGDVLSKRKMTGEMLEGFYRSCFEPDAESNAPFAASAIISNPPAFAHIHVAEALGLPLLMSFTMPWSPTSRFAHPLVNVQKSNAEPAVTNYLSYAMAETLIWQGLGDIINDFRNSLRLKPLSIVTGPMATERLGVPFTYAWSEALLPKPAEWKQNNTVVGFFNLPSNPVEYQPEESLVKFLQAGTPPVYIGFGSIVVKDPEALTQMIVAAVEKTGIRALLSAGWSKLGNVDLPESIYLIENDIPHDWLFSRVAAVCHHGGAGTTAAGLHAGLPTFIIPFFGDQRFWGTAVAMAGAGPPPVPFKNLTVDKFVFSLEVVLSDEVGQAAREIGDRLRKEDGTAAGVDSFHASLPIAAMQCDLDPTSAAVWYCKKRCLKLSAKAVGVLVDKKMLEWTDVRPIRVKEYHTSRTFVDPITASSQALLHVLTRPLLRAPEMVRNPRAGFSHAGWGMATASGDIVGELYQGFENIHGMMGARVRPQRRVSSFQDGVAQGVGGMFLGLMDGLTGLVVEPIDGYRRGGMTGLASGVAKGTFTLITRPMTGMLGFVVHPVAGGYRGYRKGKHSRGPMRAPREAESIAAAAELSEVETWSIVTKYRSATTQVETKTRRTTRRRRRSAEEIDSSFARMSPEQRAGIVARPWWEKILPPQSVVKTVQPAPKGSPKTSPKGRDKKLPPPPLPPRSRATSVSR